MARKGVAKQGTPRIRSEGKATHASSIVATRAKALEMPLQHSGNKPLATLTASRIEANVRAHAKHLQRQTKYG